MFALECYVRTYSCSTYKCVGQGRRCEVFRGAAKRKFTDESETPDPGLRTRVSSRRVEREIVARCDCGAVPIRQP